MGGQRGLLAIVFGIVALLGVTVIVVLVDEQRPPRTYPAGSPEAAFQGYVVAWEAGDYDSAWLAFTNDVRGATPLADYRRQAADFAQHGMPPGAGSRHFIDSTTLRGNQATLDVTTELTYVDGLSGSRSRIRRSFVMVLEDGAWRFDRIYMGLEPWWPNK